MRDLGVLSGVLLFPATGFVFCCCYASTPAHGLGDDYTIFLVLPLYASFSTLTNAHENLASLLCL